MRLIIDTNILLSALIRDSMTRKIIVKSDWKFYYPEMSFHEIRKYKDLAIKKSGVDESDYNKLLNKVLSYINFIPDEKIIENLDKAKKIMQNIDSDDVVFISASLGIEDSIIWSDDSDFEKQNEVKFLKTQDIVKLFNDL